MAFSEGFLCICCTLQLVFICIEPCATSKLRGELREFYRLMHPKIEKQRPEPRPRGAKAARTGQRKANSPSLPTYYTCETARCSTPPACYLRPPSAPPRTPAAGGNATTRRHLPPSYRSPYTAGSERRERRAPRKQESSSRELVRLPPPAHVRRRPSRPSKYPRVEITVEELSDSDSESPTRRKEQPVVYKKSGSRRGGKST